MKIIIKSLTKKGEAALRDQDNQKMSLKEATAFKLLFKKSIEENPYTIILSSDKKIVNMINPLSVFEMINNELGHKGCIHKKDYTITIE